MTQLLARLQTLLKVARCPIWPPRLLCCQQICLWAEHELSIKQTQQRSSGDAAKETYRAVQFAPFVILLLWNAKPDTWHLSDLSVDEGPLAANCQHIHHYLLAFNQVRLNDWVLSSTWEMQRTKQYFCEEGIYFCLSASTFISLRCSQHRKC